MAEIFGTIAIIVGLAIGAMGINVSYRMYRYGRFVVVDKHASNAVLEQALMIRK
jgi:hypothetical protein